MTDVTVVVCASGDAQQLTPTLSSLRHQGLEPGSLEILVVNDSAQPVDSLLHEAREHFERITALDQGEPLGTAAARSRALTLAQGKAVTFINAGSWFARGALAGLVQTRQHTGVDVVHGDIVLMDGLIRVLAARTWARLDEPIRYCDLPVPPGAAQLPKPLIQPGALYSTALASEGLLDAAAGTTAWAWTLATSEHTFVSTAQPVVCVPKTDAEYASEQPASCPPQILLDAYTAVLKALRAPDLPCPERRAALTRIAAAELCRSLSDTQAAGRPLGVGRPFGVGLAALRPRLESLLRGVDAEELRHIKAAYGKHLHPAVLSALTAAMNSKGRTA